MTHHDKSVIPAKAGIQPGLEESIGGIMRENENIGKSCVLRHKEGR